MKFLFISFLIIGTSHLFVDAMRGGKAGKIEEVPHMAEVFLKFLNGKTSICGAAILSEHWLLTAAHCFIGQEDLKSTRIRVKTNYTEGDAVFHNISKIVQHENYSVEAHWINDIALIEIEEAIKLDDKSHAISIAKTSPRVGDLVSISGYGKDQDIWGEILKVGQQRIISRRTCRDAYKNTPQSKFAIDSRVFCVDSLSLDLCDGDSGGPGVINGKVAGVAVDGCESPLPNVYTNVANYYDWIVNVTGLKFD